jgi:hypothetical protein
MKYEELYEKYQELLEENKRLKAENEIFKSQLELELSEFNSKTHAISNEESVLNSSGKITKYSSPKDKISLFMSLFRGREDVYAKQWQNKAGRSGYSPVCLNEWINGICNKPQVKCSSCANRNYAIFDEITIDSHLRGKSVAGIYPMLPDETCYFLAMDFDDDGWQKDVNVLRSICMENNIPFAVERSQSGNGAHTWFFFKEKISSAKVRKFGTLLLTYSMSIRHEIKFSSYDRLFPNQDTLPKGGFGN